MTGFANLPGCRSLLRQQPGLAARCKAYLNKNDVIVGEFFEQLGVAKDELVEIYTDYALVGVWALLASVSQAICAASLALSSLRP